MELEVHLLVLLARLLELLDDVFECRRRDGASSGGRGRRLRGWRRRLSTDAVQHAEGGQPLEQMGAVDLGERRLLLVLGALAMERADVGLGSRLLLGRAVGVLEAHAVGRGRLVVHRCHRVGLVSERCGLRTEHPCAGESEQGSAAWGACVGERGAAAAAARRCMAEVQGGWHAFERCVAHKVGRFLVRLQHPSIAYKQATLRAKRQATGKTVRRREQPLPETGCFLLVTPFNSC